MICALFLGKARYILNMEKIITFITNFGKCTADRLEQWRAQVVFVGATVRVLAMAICHPGQLRRKDVLYYMSFCGDQSLGIVLLICYLMGVVLGFQAAVQLREFGTEIYTADLVGFSILKELGPLMVAMIATGRAGSAFAAEIGTMKVNEELNAMETMGISPERFLILPKLLAMVLVMPVLTLFGDVAGLFGGLCVGVWMLEIPAVTYIGRSLEVLSISTLLPGLFKSVVFAILIVLTGCRHGFTAGEDAQGVGRAATQAVVDSIFMVVVADSVLTVIYSIWGY